jgi:hypothetical protein
MIQQEERQNKYSTQLNVVQGGVSNQGCWNRRHYNAQFHERNQGCWNRRHYNARLHERNQEEEMKRMNNIVQGVSNRGCWNRRQYNVQYQEMNQEEERKNK